jgi:hypothetical protein
MGISKIHEFISEMISIICFTINLSDLVRV